MLTVHKQAMHVASNCEQKVLEITHEKDTKHHSTFVPCKGLIHRGTIFGHAVLHEIFQMILDRFLTLIPNLKSVFVFWRNMKIPIPIKTV